MKWLRKFFGEKKREESMLKRQELQRQQEEGQAYAARKAELESRLARLRRMSAVLLAALAVCLLMLLVLQFGFDKNMFGWYFAVVMAAAVGAVILFLKYMDADRELARVEKAADEALMCHREAMDNATRCSLPGLEAGNG